MFALLIFIYAFLAAFIIGLLLRFGFWIIRRAVSLTWWIISNCLILLCKVLRCSFFLIVACVCAGRTTQTE